MANFKQVNKAVKAKFPTLDIEVVRGVGYVYFDGEDGLGVVDSIMTHPTSTSTDDLIRLAIDAIETTASESWEVACGGTETEFTHHGRTYIYMWNSFTKKHAYYCKTTDLFVDNYPNQEFGGDFLTEEDKERRQLEFYREQASIGDL